MTAQVHQQQPDLLSQLLGGQSGTALDNPFVKAAAAGIHTFVVGVATTKQTATDTLNKMADAGLEPRNDQRPFAPSRQFLNQQFPRPACGISQQFESNSECLARP